MAQRVTPEAPASHWAPQTAGVEWEKVLRSLPGTPSWVVCDQPGRHLGELLRRAVGEMPYLLTKSAIEVYIASSLISASISPSAIVVEDGPTLTFDESGYLRTYEETIGGT